MKAKFYHIALLFVLLISQQVVSAQEAEVKKAREIYIYGNLHYLSIDGIALKSELKNNLYFRIGTTNLNYNHVSALDNANFPVKTVSLSGGIKAGLENRVPLTQKLSAYYGADLFASATSSKNETENPETLYTSQNLIFTSGLSFGSGLILNVVKNFSVALEMEPALQMQFSTFKSVYPTYTNKDKSTGYSFHLNIDDVRLSLVYRW
jgi:hypothetical protein